MWFPMRARHPIVMRCFLAFLMGLLCLAGVGGESGRAASEVRQPIAIQFSFDRPIDASAAPFILASARGFFSAEGLAVVTDVASGSPEAIARVAANTSDLA